jgi:putative transposase
MKKQQLELLDQKFPKQYGGSLRSKAKNRGARPLSSKDSIHLVMRSTQAKGTWSFRHSNNFDKVQAFIKAFSARKGIQIVSVANVGNHLHFHIRIPNRTIYKAWIRGLTSGIAMIVLKRDGFLRLQKLKRKFWDYRPFSRVVTGFKAVLALRDYLEINQLEGVGVKRAQATIIVKGSKAFFKSG